MGSNNYFARGQWDFTCDLCGKPEKSGNGVKTWDGFYVCRRHKEKRNPQDFVRGVKDNQTVPWSRPQPLDTFVPNTCTLQGNNSIPGYGVPGCLIPSYINTAFLPAINP